MPLQHVGWRWNPLRQLVWLGKLFILEIIGNKLGAGLPLVEVHEGQLCWSDGRTDELQLAALIPWSKQQLTERVIDDLKLAVVFKYMLEDELFLRSVFSVTTWKVFAELRL